MDEKRDSKLRIIIQWILFVQNRRIVEDCVAPSARCTWQMEQFVEYF